MSKSTAARKAQETDDFLKSHLLVVRPDTGATPKEVKLQDIAEDVEIQPGDQEEKESVSITDIFNQVNKEWNEKGSKPTEVQATPTPAPVIKLSIEEIKRKNEVLSRLTAKYDDLHGKRSSLENFEISHDKDTAYMRVSDSNGEVFKSNSPKTIEKLLEFWKAEFSEAIQKIENEIREIA